MPDLVEPSLPRGTLSDRPQPIFTLTELTIRPWRPTDADALAAAYEDAEIQRWHVRSLSPTEATRWIGAATRHWATDSGGQWAVVDTADTLLGRVGIRGVDLSDGCAELGYWTVAAARGRGVATLAVDRVATWLLDLGFHRLEIEHAVSNVSSCRVAQRARFSLEGTRCSAALHADGWHDMHVHTRFADLGPGPAHDSPR